MGYLGMFWALNKIKGISILGVEPFGWISTINTPQIPELKKGGVLKKGQVGLLEGDGAEAVVPLEENTGWIRKVANQIHNFVIETKDTSKDIAGNVSGQKVEATQYEQISIINILNDKIDKIIEIMGEFFPEFVERMQHQIVLDTGALVGATAPAMDRELGRIYKHKGRGNG